MPYTQHKKEQYWYTITMYLYDHLLVPVRNMNRQIQLSKTGNIQLDHNYNIEKTLTRQPKLISNIT